MKPIQVNVDLATVDVNGIFENQTTAGAGAISLDGAEVTGGEWITPDGYAHQIAIDSAGDISGVTFTVVGFQDSARHVPLSEDITGVTTTAVESSNYFAVITGITVDGAVGSNAFAGVVDEAVSQIIPMNWRADNVSLNTSVTGTVNYTLQHTFDDVQDIDEHPYTWNSIDDSNFVTATAAQTGNLNTVPRGLRMVINSYSTGAAVELSISHSDV